MVAEHDMRDAYPEGPDHYSPAIMMAPLRPEPGTRADVPALHLLGRGPGGRRPQSIPTHRPGGRHAETRHGPRGREYTRVNHRTCADVDNSERRPPIHVDAASGEHAC